MEVKACYRKGYNPTPEQKKRDDEQVKDFAKYVQSMRPVVQPKTANWVEGV